MEFLATNDPNAISPAADDPAVQSALVIGILISGILLFAMLVYFATRDQKLPEEPVTFVQYWIYYNVWILGGDSNEHLTHENPPTELQNVPTVVNTLPQQSGSSVTSQDSTTTEQTVPRQFGSAEATVPA